MKYLFVFLFCFLVKFSNAQGASTTSASDSIYNDKTVEVMPQYPGGIENFYTYVMKNFRYPPAAEEAGVSGKLYATFVVEKDGTLTDIKIVRDLGYGTGAALVRVLQNCGKWKPGMQDHRAVRVQYTLPVALQITDRTRRRLAAAPRHQAPAGYSTLPVTPPSTETKLPLLSLKREKYVFDQKFKACAADTFLVEETKLALSDRYSILQQGIEAIPGDSLKNLTGRISLQVLVDTSGRGCLLSLKNELNMPLSNMHFEEAIKNMLWNLEPVQGGKKEAVSVILVFTFTHDQVKYQHMAFNPASAGITELEASVRGKFSRY